MVVLLAVVLVVVVVAFFPLLSMVVSWVFLGLGRVLGLAPP